MYGRLIRIGRVRFIEQLARRHQVALLKCLLRLLEARLGESFGLARAAFRRAKSIPARRAPGRPAFPASRLRKRLGEKLVQLRREILFRRRHPILGLLLVLVLQRDGGVGVMHRRRIGRKFELGEDRIDHVLFPLEQIGQQNLVLNQLRRFALQLGGVSSRAAPENGCALRPSSFCRNGISARLKRAFQNFGSSSQRFMQARLRPCRKSPAA